MHKGRIEDFGDFNFHLESHAERKEMQTKHITSWFNVFVTLIIIIIVYLLKLTEPSKTIYLQYVYYESPEFSFLFFSS
jgi:hypothetical protein